MNPQITFNINLAADTTAPASEGSASSAGDVGMGDYGSMGSADIMGAASGSLPTPSDSQGMDAASSSSGGSSLSLPSPMGSAGATSDQSMSSLPTPEGASGGASSDVGGGLPTPMADTGASSDKGGQGLPTPMDSSKTSESAGAGSEGGGSGVPSPLDGMEDKAGRGSGMSPESASSGETESESGPTEGGLPPGLDELELSGGNPPADDQQSSYNKRGKK
ncbi:MAG: hypothetical protein WCF57_14170 [Pyrinomonadaceae bacterium]